MRGREFRSLVFPQIFPACVHVRIFNTFFFGKRGKTFSIDYRNEFNKYCFIFSKSNYIRPRTATECLNMLSGRML